MLIYYVRFGAGIDFGDLAVSNTRVQTKNRVDGSAPVALMRQSSKLRQADTQLSDWQQPQPHQQELQEDNDRLARLEAEIAQLRYENTRLHADVEHLRSVLELPSASEGVAPV